MCKFCKLYISIYYYVSPINKVSLSLVLIWRHIKWMLTKLDMHSWCPGVKYCWSLSLSLSLTYSTLPWVPWPHRQPPYGGDCSSSGPGVWYCCSQRLPDQEQLQLLRPAGCDSNLGTLDGVCSEIYMMDHFAYLFIDFFFKWEQYWGGGPSHIWPDRKPLELIVTPLVRGLWAIALGWPIKAVLFHL